MKTNNGHLYSWFWCLVVLGVAPPHLPAEPPWGTTPTVEVTSAIVVDAKGTVTVDSGDAKMQPVKMQEGKPGKSVPALLSGLGATLRTGPESEATIILPSAGLVRVSANTEVRLPVLSAQASPAPVPAGTTPTSSRQSQMGRDSLELLKGSLYLKIDPAEVKKRGNATFRLKTPAALLAVKGTEFFASTDGGTDTAGVHEGEIFVYEPVSDAFISLEHDNAVTVSSGMISEPRRLTPQERRASANYKVTKIRQLVVVAKWDPLLAQGRTNFSALNPFGTVHDIPIPNRGPFSRVIQDLLLDLSSVRGTPLAIQMLVQGGMGTSVPKPVGESLSQLEGRVASLRLGSSLFLRASLSFALKMEAHQSPAQVVPLSGVFARGGAYQQTLTTVIFPLSRAVSLPKLGRVRFVLEPSPTALDEYKKVLELFQSKKTLPVASAYPGTYFGNVTGIEITGVSILVAD